VSSGLASRASSNTKTLSEDAAPIVSMMRLARSDGSMADGLSLSGQQASKQALAMQPIPKAAVSTVPGRSGGSGSVTTVKEAAAAAVAAAAKKVADMMAAKEIAAEKKVMKEATLVNAAEEAVVAR
jgi:hypothetical protein